MCTRAYHDELRRDWMVFEKATEDGFIQSSGGFIFEARQLIARPTPLTASPALWGRARLCCSAPGWWRERRARGCSGPLLAWPSRQEILQQKQMLDCAPNARKIMWLMELKQLWLMSR